ncbi:MAG: ferredoxin--NADP reductase [Bacteroidota bacterium]
MSEFHGLTVSAVEQLTPNAVALSLAIPKDLEHAFFFKAGQYITLKHHINGTELRRAYSISSTPSSGQITIGIKKTPNGTFSVYANEHIQKGDVLEVMVPEGRFTYEPSVAKKNICAFAAGSGITPIMSIAQTVLDDHPENTFVLVFGNQSPTETMYLLQLQALQNKYGERFFVQYLYSRTQVENALFGRIENATVNFILKNRFKSVDFDTFYLCGPEEMILAVSNSLKTNGIADDQILFELFTSTNTSNPSVENLDGTTKVEVVVDDETHLFTMDKKHLVLDAVLKENIDAPYSCQGGVCSSCIARITEGKVEMVKNQILTDSEVAEGLVLTCQSYPTTPFLKVDYDDV